MLVWALRHLVIVVVAAAGFAVLRQAEVSDPASLPAARAAARPAAAPLLETVLEAGPYGHFVVDVVVNGTAVHFRRRTRTIIEHLLKLEFSPAEEPKRGWRQTIRTQRRDLADVITPTLRQDLLVELPELYERTRADLAEDFRDYGERTAADALPQTCPYTLEQILEAWLPAAPQP